MEKKKCLNLGSGRDYKKSNKYEDWVNVDMKKPCDVLHDLNIFPYPFKNNVFDKVIMKHTLEHMLQAWETLREIDRIANKGCVLYFELPIWSNHPEHHNNKHTELYLRSLYKEFQCKKFHFGNYYMQGSYNKIRLGHKDRFPLPRMVFQMYVRFKYWVLSFIYVTIYFEIEKK